MVVANAVGACSWVADLGLAEDGRQIFRWHAVSAQWSCYLWNTLPREFSPCGTVLDPAFMKGLIG